MKYFQYVSRSKIELLYQQLCLNKPSLAEVSPKINVAGFGLEFGVKKENQANDTLFKKTSELLVELNKQNLIQEITDKTVLATKDFYQNEGIWHHGLLRWNLLIGRNSNSQKGEVEAYCLFKVINNSLTLLVGSPSNLLGYGDETTKSFDEPISTSALLYVKLYRSMYQYVKMEEQMKKTSPSNTIFMGNKVLESAFSLELGVFCISVVGNLPEKNIDTVFKIYSRYNLRRNAAQLAQFSDQERQRVERAIEQDEERKKRGDKGIGGVGLMMNPAAFIRKAESVNLFQFRYLNIGSPIYTAIQ